MAVVELRCAHGHLRGVLDTARGVVTVACPQCRHATRERVVHVFDVQTGEPLPDADPPPERILRTSSADAERDD